MMPDGSIIPCAKKSVARKTKENPSLKRDNGESEISGISFPIKGYRGFGGLTIGIGNKFVRVSEFTTHGYQANPNIFIGGGIATQSWIKMVEEYDKITVYNALSIAFYANLRTDIIAKRKCSPFVTLRIGGFAGQKELKGMYVSPLVGARIKHFNIFIGTEVQPVKYKYDSNNYHSESKSETVGYATFQFGIAFDWGSR